MENQVNVIFARRLIAAGGLANVIGGVFVALAYVLHPPVPEPEVVASGLWAFVHVSFMISLLGGVFALFAFLGSYVSAGGKLLGTIGCCMAVTSLIMIFGLDYAEVFIFPVLAVEFPEVVIKYGDGTMMPSVAFAFPLSGVLFLMGYLIFTNELRRVGSISILSAVTLMLGTVAFGAGLSGMFPMIVVQLGAVLFGVGLVWTGLSMYRKMASDK